MTGAFFLRVDAAQVLFDVRPLVASEVCYRIVMYIFIYRILSFVFALPAIHDPITGEHGGAGRPPKTVG